ncbi:uncharacterized protein C8orf76 homolog [Microcaecilia unicolor]|uniref:Uncharacterized protein C8orf76 homolog n=1 Tax=Microcaecilia unicolor TaxID=1415580 RepID=A0A6P7X668_9AMPH|nr:uncharacterized protein C8orf76 homolog [Microcaecilia unicolor]
MRTCLSASGRRTRNLQPRITTELRRLARSFRSEQLSSRRPQPPIGNMEPLGWEFEESLFSESEDKSPPPVLAAANSYTAKVCAPQWFCREIRSEDYAEVLTTKKFSGDLAYRQQNFKKALQEYSSCLLLLPVSNTAMKRDVQESQARCLLHLGRHEEALGIAQKLRNRVMNIDHLTAVLNLQIAIHSSLSKWQKAISCLQQLVSLHPFNPSHWKKLAEAYINLAQTVSTSSVQQTPGEGLRNYGGSLVQCHKAPTMREPSCSNYSAEQNGRTASFLKDDQTGGQKDFSGTTQDGTKPFVYGLRTQENRKEIEIIACASFVRSRLLLQFMQSQQASFVLENNIKTQQEIEENLKSLALHEETLSWITEVMGEDLTPERMKEEAQVEWKCGGSTALAASVIISDEEFTNRWFRKTKDGFSHCETSLGHTQTPEYGSSCEPD